MFLGSQRYEKWVISLYQKYQKIQRHSKDKQGIIENKEDKDWLELAAARRNCKVSSSIRKFGDQRRIILQGNWKRKRTTAVLNSTLLLH